MFASLKQGWGKRLYAGLFILGFLVPVLVACGDNTFTTGPAPVGTGSNSVASPTTPNTAAPGNTSQSAASGAATSAPTGEVTLYTSEPQDLVNQMKVDFEKVYPGVKLNIFRDGTEKVVAKIQAEQQAGTIQADLLWFANYAFLKNLGDKDQLLSTNPLEAAKLPAGYRYLDGKMYEVRVILNTVSYTHLTLPTT